MIEFLFSMVLVPLLPSLADPEHIHRVAMGDLQQRLQHAGRPAAADPATINVALSDSRLSAPDLPPISGRIFDWSNRVSAMAGQSSGAVVSADALRLTGVIEASGEYVGILNDGETDHVVGVGSYVMEAYRVASLSKRRIVLTPLDTGSGNTPVELSLVPGDLPRGIQ